MTLDLQFKIKENEYYKTYLREHSYWYKTLNRDPNTFKAFEEEVKEFYGLRPVDRITKALNTIEMVQSIMSTLR